MAGYISLLRYIVRESTIRPKIFAMNAMTCSIMPQNGVIYVRSTLNPAVKTATFIAIEMSIERRFAK